MHSPTANDWPVMDAFLARDTYKSAASSSSAFVKLAKASFLLPVEIVDQPLVSVQFD